MDGQHEKFFVNIDGGVVVSVRYNAQDLAVHSLTDQIVL